MCNKCYQEPVEPSHPDHYVAFVPMPTTSACILSLRAFSGDLATVSPVGQVRQLSAWEQPWPTADGSWYLNIHLLALQVGWFWDAGFLLGPRFLSQDSVPFTHNSTLHKNKPLIGCLPCPVSDSSGNFFPNNDIPKYYLCLNPCHRVCFSGSQTETGRYRWEMW